MQVATFFFTLLNNLQCTNQSLQMQNYTRNTNTTTNHLSKKHWTLRKITVVSLFDSTLTGILFLLSVVPCQDG